MNERQVKQWALIETLLSSVAVEVAGTPAYDAYRNYVEHNEFELALDVLEDAGHERQASRDYWWNLKKAAEVMGLHERYAALHAQVRLAKNNAQQGIPADIPKAEPSDASGAST